MAAGAQPNTPAALRPERKFPDVELPAAGAPYAHLSRPTPPREKDAAVRRKCGGPARQLSSAGGGQAPLLAAALGSVSSATRPPRDVEQRRPCVLSGRRAAAASPAASSATRSHEGRRRTCVEVAPCRGRPAAASLLPPSHRAHALKARPRRLPAIERVLVVEVPHRGKEPGGGATPESWSPGTCA